MHQYTLYMDRTNDVKYKGSLMVQVIGIYTSNERQWTMILILLLRTGGHNRGFWWLHGGSDNNTIIEVQNGNSNIAGGHIVGEYNNIHS